VLPMVRAEAFCWWCEWWGGLQAVWWNAGTRVSGTSTGLPRMYNHSFFRDILSSLDAQVGFADCC
jgi:hypothetical protein